MIKTKGKEKKPLKKELDFNYCPRHNLTYPKGSVCPGCQAERRKKN